MGKKSKSSDLTKAERKALEKREAAIAAELEARAEKMRKAKKKGKAEPDLSGLKRKALKALVADKTNGKTLRGAAKAELARRDKPVDWSAPVARRVAAGILTKKEANTLPEAELKKLAEEREAATKPVKPKREKSAPEVAADEAMAGAKENAAKQNAAIDAKAEKARKAKLDEPDDEATVAAVKARVASKTARRKQLADEEYRAGIDRSDDAAVRAYNEEAAALGLGRFLTSDAEREALVGVTDNSATPEKPVKKAKKAKRVDDFTEHEGKTDEELEALLAADQVAEVVETETGTIIAVGTPHPADARGVAIPSDAPLGDFETNGNGQYKVKRPTDGKKVGYTRVTSFIATNEDRTLLEQWKMRILLEGVALNDTPDAEGNFADEVVVAKVRNLIHRRDVAIAKARKDDRKGKLALGQYGTLVDGAWAEFRRELNTLAESLLELGGAHEKAAKGTQLHELFELYDRKGMDAIDALAIEGHITNADLADVEAYARAIKAAGIEILPEYIEAPVVIHEEKVAGRLDRVVLARMPGSQRAARYVLDVKSGRIDLGAGKIAQQLEKYSKGTPYDLDKDEDLPPHKASRTKALVLHLVPGSAEAHIYVVDLSTGRIGNDLSAKVRAYRNDGKRAIDTTVDLAAVTS